MNRPFLLAHLSDPHIGAEWASGHDPIAGLRAAVEGVAAMRPSADALLISGDLADNATDAEYELVRDICAVLDVPVHVLPGNHDDREALRRHFDVPGANGEPIQYSLQLGPLRLVVLDSTRPGEIPGELDNARLDWLDRELALAPDNPTLLALHHPPLLTGMPAWDEIGLAASSQRALAEIVERHPQIRKIVSGHVHRAIAGSISDRPVLSVPSTYVQASLRFDSSEIEFASHPAAFTVHTIVNGDIVSTLQPV
jgi:Icc protein